MGTPPRPDKITGNDSGFDQIEIGCGDGETQTKNDGFFFFLVGRPAPGTLFGSGNVEMLRGIVAENEIGLVVVDGPFLLYRSFFALPDSIKGVDSRPVNALLGGANVLLRLIGDRDPRAIVVCFGAEAAAYRVELYPPYHADRPPVPDALQWQFDQAPSFWAEFGWLSADQAELEADDLLGSFAKAEAAAGGTTLILTGDRDMYQCAD